MAQILVPVSDISVGAWTPTPLWSKIDDDSTVNPSGDGTEVVSDDNTSEDNFDVALSTGTDPSSSTNHVLRARWYRNQAGDHSVHGELELWQGTPGTGTLIATLVSAQPIETSEVEDTYTLSGTEADNITDYSDLSLRVLRVGGNGGPQNSRETLNVDLVELEIPDASTDRAGQASFAELETPDAPRAGQVSHVELETSDAPRQGQVSHAELEAPDAPAEDWAIVDSDFHAQAAGSSTTTVTVQEGDLIVVLASNRSGYSGTISVSDDGDAGNPYVEAPNYPQVWKSADADMRTFADVWMKVANATDAGTLTVDIADVGDEQWQSTIVLRPSESNNPIDLTSMTGVLGGTDFDDAGGVNVSSVTTSDITPSSATYLKLGLGFVKKGVATHSPFTYDQSLTSETEHEDGDSNGMAHGLGRHLDTESTTQSLTFTIDTATDRALLAGYVLIPEQTSGRQGQISHAELETADAPRQGQISHAELESPDAPRSGQVSHAELETSDAPRQGQVSFAELEAEDAPRQGQISHAELETADAPRKGQISFAELETEDAARTGQVSFTELEAPTAPRQGQVSYAALESPDAPSTDRRGEISFAELETQDAPRQGQISHAELETADAPRSGQISHAEMETTDAPRSAQISFTELEAEAAPRAGQLSFAELETADAPRAGQISFTELETADAPRSGQLSFAELETDDAPRSGQISFAELETGTAPRQGQISFATLETGDAPSTDRRGQLAHAEMEVADAPRATQLSFAALETDEAPRKAQTSFAELETPTAPRSAEVSHAEVETTDAPRQGQISFAALETDNAPRRAQVSTAELETATAPRTAQVSFAELETLDAGENRASEIAYAALEAPQLPFGPSGKEYHETGRRTRARRLRDKMKHRSRYNRHRGPG